MFAKINRAQAKAQKVGTPKKSATYLKKSGKYSIPSKFTILEMQWDWQVYYDPV